MICYNVKNPFPFGQPMNRNNFNSSLVGISIASIVGGLFLAAIIYSTTKAGFGFNGKTLMDWIELLIIPVTLAIAVYLLNNFDKQRENERATDQKREDALQHYIDKVTEILRSNNQLSDKDITSIKIRTLTVLRMLNGERKAHIIKFLFEAGLICNRTITRRKGGNDEKIQEYALLSLAGADLSYINLEKANFYIIDDGRPEVATQSKIDLSGADLTGANFQDADIRGANFIKAKLKAANLKNVHATFSTFRGSDLSEAMLTSSYFGAVDFSGAKLARTQCRKTNFGDSNFFNSSYHEYGNAFVDKTDFSGANLTYANFLDANIFPEQLKKARLLWKILLPSFSLYSGYHPLFSLVTENRNSKGVLSNDETKIICGCKERLEIDRQKIIAENSETNDFGVEISNIDIEKELLKEAWKKYDRHRFNVFAGNIIGRILYIFLEYHPSSYVPEDNFFQKKFS